ncbi:hypothetical protein [Actinoplanes utahensis]|nr:hypothetical protein [Actinoplanes utahensis]GIF28967.1 hypothetical protein Aut01nite_19530 [Actinoplanes utahensis]
MTVQAEGRFWSGIDIPKTVAGTLAAVSAAVLGSFLGVAGTLIGAALASAISSIGTEIYHRSIDHGRKKLQSTFTVAPAAAGTPEVPAAEEPPSGEAPRRIHWKRVALVAGAFFALGMGILTTAEMFAGRSAADVTSGRDSGSPTITFPVGSDDRDDRNQDEQERQPAPATSAEAPATTTTEQPAPTDPATTAPTEPAPADSAPTGATPTTGDQPDTGGAQPEPTAPDAGTGTGQAGNDAGTGPGQAANDAGGGPGQTGETGE